MDKVRKMGSIAGVLVFMPLPLIWLASQFPSLAILDKLAILSSFAGLLLAVVAVIYWVVLYRAKSKGRPSLNL